MSKNLHDIDDLFNKALRQHKETPSPDVWDAIDKNLDKKKVVSISRKYIKLKWAAAVLLLFSFAMAMYTLRTGIKNRELVKQNKIEKASKKNKDAEKSDEKEPENPKVIKSNNENNSAKKDNKQFIHQGEQPAINTQPVSRQPPGFSAQTPAMQHNSKTSEFITAKRNTIQSNKRAQNDHHAGYANPVYAGKANGKDGDVIAKQSEDESRNREDNNPGVAKGEITRSPDSKPPQKYSTGIPLIFSDQQQPGNILQVDSSILLAYNPQVLNNKPAPAKNNIAAQVKRAPAKLVKRSSFFASVFVSPEFVSFNVKDDHPRYREDNRSQIKNNEKPGSSVNYGILLGYNVGNNWMLGAGVSIFSAVTNINTKTVYARPDNRGNIYYRLSYSAGSAFVPLKSAANLMQGDSTKILSAKNTLRYVSIPLVAKYIIGRGRFTMVPSVGIAANILSRGKMQTMILTTGGYETSGVNYIQGLKSVFFNSQLSLGAAYNVSKNVQLNFTPVVKPALSSINKDEAVITRLNSFGLSAGVTIKL